jgi:DNA polymerase III subunit gamma/tau
VENFIVSARKYRPQNFATVVGQAHITTTLKNAIQHNTLAHAFLFCGPRGVGKTTCARILAKTINCENLQPDGEACNTCHSCTAFNQGTSLNIHELDAASNNSVDDIRELVNQIRYAPQEGKYKIYIIDEVHMLSTNAFNAFLKTLEEPPAYAKFILATTEKHKLLPTILSRCQIFDFKRITNVDTVNHLVDIMAVEQTRADRAALHLIAQKSEGCMRDALSMLDKIVSFTGGELTYANTLEHLNLLDEDYFFKLLEALQQQDLAAALLLYDEINQKGFEGDTVLNGLAEFMRNLLVCLDERAAVLLDVAEGMHHRYAKTAKNVSLDYLLSAINALAMAESGFRMARNKRLHVELCLIKLCYLQQAVDFAVTAQGEVKAQKRIGDRPVAVRTKLVEPSVLVASPPVVAPAKLFVEIGSAETPTPVSPMALPQTLPVVAEPEVAKMPVPQIALSTPTQGVKRPILLDSIRLQHEVKEVPHTPAAPVAMTMESVLPIFTQYIDRLKTDQKLVAVSSMSMAQLIVNEDVVEIIGNSWFNVKAIESELPELLAELKRVFNNPAIKIETVNGENDLSSEQTPLKHLSSHNRYQLMATTYPLVKQLKDALGLELRYS